MTHKKKLTIEGQELFLRYCSYCKEVKCEKIFTKEDMVILRFYFPKIIEKDEDSNIVLLLEQYLEIKKLAEKSKNEIF